jgi:pyruvate/2-oxoacid:ferredoxin oxidoreductase beta subunit
MAIIFQKPKALKDKSMHYCPGCTHGIAHRLVAEALDELEIEGKPSELHLSAVPITATNISTAT